MFRASVEILHIQAALLAWIHLERNLNETKMCFSGQGFQYFLLSGVTVKVWMFLLPQDLGRDAPDESLQIS